MKKKRQPCLTRLHTRYMSLELDYYGIMCRLRRCGSNLPEGVVLVNHHMHKKLAFSSLLHSLRHTLLGSICCMQTYFYLDEVSRHCQSYWQRSATRKMTGKYLYTTITHERKRIKKIPTYFLKILTSSII